MKKTLFKMAVMYYFCILLYVCGTFGHSEKPDFDDVDDDLEYMLTGKVETSVSHDHSQFLGDSEHSHDHHYKGGMTSHKSLKRKRRFVYQENMEEVVNNLIEEVEIMKEHIMLLEKDNAHFQQTVATVMKITDDRLSSYTCGCLKYILREQGVFPCEFTKEVTSVVMETSTIADIMPTSTVVEPSIPPFSPDMVQYLDSPIPKPLEPSIVAVSYYGHFFHRYILENKSVEVLHHERRVTHALTFDPNEEKIIWSSFTPAVIYSSNIDGTNLTALQRDILSYGLEVDAERGLLFLSTVSPRHSVSVMDTDGSGYRAIAHVGKYGRPTRLTLDTKNESIYVSFRGRILKLAYDGGQQSVFIRGKFITTLSFDRINGILYYADRITIQRVVDTKGETGKSEQVIKFKPKTGSFPSDIFVDDDSLYLGYKFKPTVEVMSLSNKTLSVLTQVDGDYVSLTLVR